MKRLSAAFGFPPPDAGRFVAVAAILLWAGVSDTRAETVTGTLVLDLDGLPVPGAQVTLWEGAHRLDSTRTDEAGRFALTSDASTAITDQEVVPRQTELLPPYPNPFNPTIRIRWALDGLQPVTIRIYNALGQPVRTLHDGLQPAGPGETVWDGTDGARRPVGAGVYFVRLQTAATRQTRAITLLDGSAGPPASGRIADPVPDWHLQIEAGAVAPHRWPVAHAGDQGSIEVAAGRDTLVLGGAPYTLRGIPGGPFTMGSAHYDDERPARTVTLSPFWLGTHEVTTEQYAAGVVAGACAAPAEGSPCNDLDAPESGKHPANCVTWYDAAAFCQWVGLQLPTEAQWEKAARGSQGWLYPWGDEPPGGAGNCDRAVMMRAGLGLGCGYDGTAPVGERPDGASVYGLHDMAGNVWEWTADAYVADAALRTDTHNPLYDEPGAWRRSVRGNSWYYTDPNPDLRAANRFAFGAGQWWPYVGFRCARPDLPPAPSTAAAQVAVDPPVETEDAATAAANWLERNRLVAAALGRGPSPQPVPADDDMARVPMGRVRMGSADGDSDERPIREVVVDAFRIDRFEVTVAQFRRCVDEGTCHEPHHGALTYRLEFEGQYLNWTRPGGEAHPINGVSWYDARTYCEWAGKRLPTEAEWERAARGDDGRLYPWGNEDATCERAIIDEGGDGCGQEMAWPVGSRPDGVSPFGVHDMAGNLWEWTQDWYARDFYGRGIVDNPRNDEEGEGLKVLRGGSMADQNPRIQRATNRLGYLPNQRFDYTIGFRCAADDAP